jgi:hypothetical protein
MSLQQALRSARSETGSALILCVMALMSLLVLGIAIMAMGTTEVSIAANWSDYSRAFYAAEAGLESAAGGLRTQLANGAALSAAQLTAVTSTPPSLSYAQGLTFATYTVTRDNPNPPYNYMTTIPTGPFTGLVGLVTGYTVNSQVVAASGARANLFQGVQHIAVPLFQFAIFYGRGVDLEMAPGAPMTVNGRIHSNSNLYFGPVSSLNVDSYVTTSGSVVRGIKRDPSIPCCGGTVQVKDAAGNYQTLNFDHLHNTSWGSWTVPEWQAAANTSFGGRLNDSAMGVTDITPPIPELFQNPTNPDVVAHKMIEMPKAGDSAELSAAKLYTQAGLRIIDGVATDQAGNPVALPAGTLATKTFWDQREGRNMTVTEVDISKVNTVAPANGLLYVGNTTLSNGVRLKNGSQLPNQGLTVASENPLYVLGDWNTKGKDGAVVSHAPGNTTPISNMIPSAILADAVTVLSNNWVPNNSDTKGNLGAGNRVATDTTVNAAFALGPNAESAVGAGNGQVENVIRFLEHWSGKNFNYNGSIVALWHSLNATGAWRNTGTSLPAYYTAPIRNWSYDTLFNSIPPPGTPMGVIITKGQWSQK